MRRSAIIAAAGVAVTLIFIHERRPESRDVPYFTVDPPPRNDRRDAPSPPPEPRRSPIPYPVWRHTPRQSGDPVLNPDVPPRLIESVEPEYTEVARKARVTGIVILELVIEPDGRVSGGNVLKHLPYGLTDKAIEAVEHWKFEPARHRGKPVRAIYNAMVHFKL